MAPARRVIVSPLARRDLETIRAYSRRRWGPERTTVYLKALRERIRLLSDNPEIGLQISPTHPHLRRLLSERHIIYYALRTSEIEVLRVRHERADQAELFD